MSTTQASACTICTAKYYCTDGIHLIDCPQGNYCPDGTGDVGIKCPIGTYGGSPNLAAITDCTQCTGGSYCSVAGQTAVTGSCSSAYFCTSGSDSPTPTGDIGTAGVCPAGHYCGAATVDPTPCPMGTYSNTSGLSLVSECTTCDPGFYCGSTGLLQPTDVCDLGYYCLQGATVPNNPTTDSTGGPCTTGHYCPAGTSNPLGCDPGTYRYIEFKLFAQLFACQR